jgi:hypothetical protein
MLIMSRENFPDTSQPPNNVYKEGLVSWVMTSEDEWDGRYGVVESGVEATFPVDTDERIWLHEPTGNQQLDIEVLEPGEDYKRISAHSLRGEGVLYIAAGHKIHISTPEGQGEVDYFCDYPGVEPTSSH